MLSTIKIIRLPIFTRALCVLAVIFFSHNGFSQNDTDRVRLIGQVYDPYLSDLSYSVMVVNKSTGRGTYGETDGGFNITFNKKDTILISTRGYKLIKLCFADSAYKKVRNMRIKLDLLKYNLKPVTVFAPRDLDEIKADIDQLGYDRKDYLLSPVNAAESPITFLYQNLSRKVQKTLEAYEYANEMKRRELLKELFSKYVQHEIIMLEDHQFDRFIDFCDVSDAQLKTLSQYDFIMYIKERYRIFSIVDGDDYYYDRGK